MKFLCCVGSIFHFVYRKFRENFNLNNPVNSYICIGKEVDKVIARRVPVAG